MSGKQTFTRLEIARPVEGAGAFLDKVRYHGQQAFGQDYSGVITESSVAEDNEDDPLNGEDEFGKPILIIRGVGSPRLKVYDEEDLAITLMDRRVPADMKSGSFNWVAGRLIAKGERIYRPIKKDGQIIPKAERNKPVYRTSGLYRALDQAGIPFDIMPHEQAELPLAFRAIGSCNDFTQEQGGLELGLVPSPAETVTAMLVQQSALCFRALRSYSKRAAFPVNPGSLNVPFARMPEASSLEARRNFIEAVEELLPLRLVMGYYRTNVHYASNGSKPSPK